MSNKKYFPTEEDLKVIRDLYDSTTSKIDKIMSLLGDKYPRYEVRRLANLLGLARPGTKDWSDREIEILHEFYPRYSFERLSKRLKRVNGGTYRSPTSIQIKAKREHINKRSDGFTMRMVEDLLGADHHKIDKWVERGWLKNGTRKGTNRTKLQGGDMRHFEAKDLREFVITYPDEIDLRRVEPQSFIHLVAGLM